MSLPFPSLRELSMRKVLLEDLPWQEGLEGLPMKKELEALDRLPGKYTVTKTSRKVIKDGTLGQEEARRADKLAGKGSFKKGCEETLLSCGELMTGKNQENLVFTSCSRCSMIVN